MHLTIPLSPRRIVFGVFLVGFSGWTGWNTHIDRVIVNAARREGVPPLLLWSVGVQESNLNPEAVGAAGEVGMFQIMPNTAKHWAEQTGQEVPTEEELFRASMNAEISAWYLAQGLEEFKRSEDPPAYALAYYNAGPSRARTWQEDVPEGIAFREYIPFSTTRKYVKEVLERARFRKR